MGKLIDFFSDVYLLCTFKILLNEVLLYNWGQNI